MNLLDVVNINDEERIFKCNNTRTFYKMENDDLLFKKEDDKEWTRSTLTIRELREYNVEEIQEGRKKTHGEIYYFIDDEGNIVGDEEIFSTVDDNRYELGNYFESKEEAEMCRELIEKTIKAFKGRNMSKREREEELEKEFIKTEGVKLIDRLANELKIDSIYASFDAFKKNKECIYLVVNGEGIVLSFSDWDLLNQYVGKLRKFK